MTGKPFTVIDGTPEPDKALAKRRATAKALLPPEFIRCPSCTGNAMIQIRLGMVRKFKGRPASGGQKQTVCAACLTQGRIVPVDT